MSANNVISTTTNSTSEDDEKIIKTLSSLSLTNNEQLLFQYGDRVKIMNLKLKNDNSNINININPRNELNGQHGSIAYEGGKICLSNGCYSIHLDRLKPVGIQIQPKNIEKVSAAIIINNQQQIASVIDGTLQDHGMLILNILNLLKWFIANKYFKDEGVNELHNIQNVPLTKRIEYNKYMIENWCIKTKNSAGVYLDFYQFIYGSQNNNNTIHPKQRIFMIQALNNIIAMKGWYTSLLNESLWFVGKDYYGIYVIPDSNRMKVYRIVGLNRSILESSKSIYIPTPNDKPALNKVPRKFNNVLVMPWYNRLIYDMTTITNDLTQTETANVDLAIQLHAVVLKSIQESSYIDHFTELNELSTIQQQQKQKAMATEQQTQTTGTSSDPLLFNTPLN